jgi:hypothetical protein
MPRSENVASLPCNDRLHEKMAMEIKIFRTGSSAVVSIPPEALEALRLELGDEVTVTIDHEPARVVLTPATLPGIRPAFPDQVDRFLERYQPALEALAEE